MDCHFDQRDDCTDTGGRAMQGAIAEKSYQVVEVKISPVVEMTGVCHLTEFNTHLSN